MSYDYNDIEAVFEMFDISSFRTKLMKMYFEYTSKWRKALVILLEYIPLAPTFVPKVVSDYCRRMGHRHQ